MMKILPFLQDLTEFIFDVLAEDGPA